MSFVIVPYACAGLGGLTITLCMLSPSLINTQLLISEAESASSSGSIDNTINMANDKIFLYNGLSDTVVNNGEILSLLPHVITAPFALGKSFH